MRPQFLGLLPERPVPPAPHRSNGPLKPFAGVCEELRSLQALGHASAFRRYMAGRECQCLGTIRGKQKKKPFVRSALMKLSRRVEVTRTVTGGRSDSHFVSHNRANPPQPALVNFIFIKVGQDGEIIILAARWKNSDNACGTLEAPPAR